MSNKVSIVLFSGTVDKLMAAAILATGAAAMGKDVSIFLTMWGVMAFRKGDWKTNIRISKDFEDQAPAMLRSMSEKKVPGWLENFKSAQEIGNVKIVACGMTMDLFELKLEDLEPVVTDVDGVASFWNQVEDGTALFL